MEARHIFYSAINDTVPELQMDRKTPTGVSFLIHVVHEAHPSSEEHAIIFKFD